MDYKMTTTTKSIIMKNFKEELTIVKHYSNLIKKLIFKLKKETNINNLWYLELHSRYLIDIDKKHIKVKNNSVIPIKINNKIKWHIWKQDLCGNIETNKYEYPDFEKIIREFYEL
tara:strand:+ start:2425 stop:2769 length:345 start_codon:yes stop_codon:yes gene_type:complete